MRGSARKTSVSRRTPAEEEEVSKGTRGEKFSRSEWRDEDESFVKPHTKRSVRSMRRLSCAAEEPFVQKHNLMVLE